MLVPRLHNTGRVSFITEATTQSALRCEGIRVPQNGPSNFNQILISRRFRHTAAVVKIAFNNRVVDNKFTSATMCKLLYSEYF